MGVRFPSRLQTQLGVFSGFYTRKPEPSSCHRTVQNWTGGALPKVPYAVPAWSAMIALRGGSYLFFICPRPDRPGWWGGAVGHSRRSMVVSTKKYRVVESYWSIKVQKRKRFLFFHYWTDVMETHYSGVRWAKIFDTYTKAIEFANSLD